MARISKKEVMLPHPVYLKSGGRDQAFVFPRVESVSPRLSWQIPPFFEPVVKYRYLYAVYWQRWKFASWDLLEKFWTVNVILLHLYCCIKIIVMLVHVFGACLIETLIFMLKKFILILDLVRCQQNILVADLFICGNDVCILHRIIKCLYKIVRKVK